MSVPLVLASVLVLGQGCRRSRCRWLLASVLASVRVSLVSLPVMLALGLASMQGCRRWRCL